MEAGQAPLPRALAEHRVDGTEILSVHYDPLKNGCLSFVANSGLLGTTQIRIDPDKREISKILETIENTKKKLSFPNPRDIDIHPFLHRTTTEHFVNNDYTTTE